MDLRQEQMKLQYIMDSELDWKKGARGGLFYDADNDRVVWGIRSITLKEASSLFKKSRGDEISPEGELAERGIYFLFEQILAEKGRVVWIDLGCGNAIALRQAKMHFEQTGMGIDNLVTIGYDVLPFDRFEYRVRRTQDPSKYHEDDWEPRYEPDFAMADIRDVAFPEAPDIVTCIGVMQWSSQPLEIFANAARQLPEGAYIGISGMDCCQRENGWDSESNPVIDPAVGPVPGFEAVKLREAHPPNIISFRRTEEPVPDFTFGFKNLRSIHPKDELLGIQRSFVTYYGNGHA